MQITNRNMLIFLTILGAIMLLLLSQLHPDSKLPVEYQESVSDELFMLPDRMEPVQDEATVTAISVHQL